MADATLGPESGWQAAQTGPDGRFRLRHLSRLPPRMLVGAEGYIPTHFGFDPSHTASPIVVVLRKGGTLMGHVAPASGGVGADLRVTVEPVDPSTPEPNYEGPQIEADGRFRTTLSEGRYRVSVKRGDDVLVTREVSLVEGHETPLELSLP